MVMEIKRLLLPLLPQSHHTLHYTTHASALDTNIEQQQHIYSY